MKKSLLLSAVLAATAGFAIHAYRPLETMDVFRAHAGAIKILDAHTREFGHPMVLGGIHTLAELERYRALYPNLGADVRMTTLKNGIFAYVSYRKDGKTYWTKNKRYIPSNEPIITDGTMMILQRCGNMVGYNPPMPIDTLENEPGDLYPPSTPVDPSGTEFRVGPPIEDEALIPPAETIYSQPDVPMVANAPVFVPFGVSAIPQAPVVASPESSTLVALSFGILFVMFMRFFIWRP